MIISSIISFLIFENTGSMYWEIESANIAFIPKPIEKINIPKIIFFIFIGLNLFNCGIKDFGLTIGPAIKCGKKNKYP
jgi:hypothetical protein